MLVYHSLSFKTIASVLVDIISEHMNFKILSFLSSQANSSKWLRTQTFRLKASGIVFTVGMHRQTLSFKLSPTSQTIEIGTRGVRNLPFPMVSWWAGDGRVVRGDASRNECPESNLWNSSYGKSYGTLVKPGTLKGISCWFYRFLKCRLHRTSMCWRGAVGLCRDGWQCLSVSKRSLPQIMEHHVGSNSGSQYLDGAYTSSNIWCELRVSWLSRIWHMCRTWRSMQKRDMHRRDCLQKLHQQNLAFK